MWDGNGLLAPAGDGSCVERRPVWVCTAVWWQGLVAAFMVLGSLLPAGPGPFPAVIDLFGGAGGLIEFRAGLLASRGFAVLALAFFAYEDLPKGLTQLDLDYFEEAANLLLQHPKVSAVVWWAASANRDTLMNEVVRRAGIILGMSWCHGGRGEERCPGGQGHPPGD